MLHSTWREHLRQLAHYGNPIGPRGFATQEILDQRVFLADSCYNVLEHPLRGLNYRFMVAEWLWMTFGRSDVASISRYCSVIKRFSDDGISFAGAYGPHLGGQRKRVINKLKSDAATRQAVFEIHRPRVDTKDEPCTLSLQFLLRNDLLHLIATMRSSDAWLGVPYDIFNFTQFQNCLAGELGVDRGWFSLRMGSAHLYERDLAAATAVLESSPLSGETLWTQQLPGFPPVWLEEILVHGEDAVNGKRSAIRYAADDPWAPYADALLASSSAAALNVLRRMTR